MIIKYTDNERDILARLMRAEALGEGALGMLMVGDVVINRVLADCLTFKNVNSLTKAIYQSPGGFSGINSSLFNSAPTSKERQLADRVLKGEYYYPATNSLWFYATNGNCKTNWYGQGYVGKYKNHCFYQPEIGVCPQIR